MNCPAWRCWSFSVAKMMLPARTASSIRVTMEEMEMNLPVMPMGPASPAGAGGGRAGSSDDYFTTAPASAALRMPLSRK